MATHLAPFRWTRATDLGAVETPDATPGNANLLRPAGGTAPPSPSAFTSLAGWPPGPPGETSTATSVAKAASRATPSPSANAHVACHARRDAPSLFTTVNDAWNENADESPASRWLASAAYSTSSAHLAAQSAASRAHHPPGAPLGEHTRASSAMAVRREPPASTSRPLFARSPRTERRGARTTSLLQIGSIGAA